MAEKRIGKRKAGTGQRTAAAGKRPAKTLGRRDAPKAKAGGADAEKARTAKVKPTGPAAPAPPAADEADRSPAPEAGPKPQPSSGAEPKPEPRPGHAAGDSFRELGDLADRAADSFKRFVRRVRDEARPTADRAADATRRMSVDLGGGLDKAWEEIRAQAKDLAAKGRHTRVRIKFKDRQLVELPIAVVAAAEVASFAAFGPFRLVLGHLVGKAVLDVEFVSDADAVVAEGRALLADGELERALALFDKALAMDRRCAAAHLGRGIAQKLRGDKAAAKAAFAEAEKLDPLGESGREARRHLDNLGES
jgi:tetratricopeptide (TPR) repeat protein